MDSKDVLLTPAPWGNITKFDNGNHGSKSLTTAPPSSNITDALGMSIKNVDERAGSLTMWFT